MLGEGLYQRTNWPTPTAKFPSLVNPLALRMLGDSPSVEIQASEHFEPTLPRKPTVPSVPYGEDGGTRYLGRQFIQTDRPKAE